MKNIALTGMMGCGKSTVSKELKKLLPEFNYIDLDLEIEKKENKTINEIFSDKGEEYFRIIESQLLEEITNRDNQIISLGGGAFLSEQNRKKLSLNSISIYLETSVSTIYDRIKDDTSRPLLKTENVKDKIADLLNNRELRYKLADFTVSTENKTPKNIAKEILEILRNNGN